MNSRRCGKAVKRGTKSRVKANTNKWLQNSFEMLNEDYFDGRIHNVVVKFGGVSEKHDAHFNPATREIRISPRLKTHEGLIFICLLHEMSHALLSQEGYVGDSTDKDWYHGLRWQGEICRLFQIGAYDGLL